MNTSNKTTKKASGRVGVYVSLPKTMMENLKTLKGTYGVSIQGMIQSAIDEWLSDVASQELKLGKKKSA